MTSTMTSASRAEAPFPGVFAHHRGPCDRLGHGPAFHRATVEEGLDASSYFEASGIAALADAHGGACTFWLGETPAIYQNTNAPLVGDDDLAPSIDANAELFGSFVGSLINADPRRRARRDAIERVFGSKPHVDGCAPAARRLIEAFLARRAGQPMSTEDLALLVVAHVDSHLPGLLDLTEKPLTAYLEASPYSQVARSFFEIASKVISVVDPDAIRDSEMIVDLARDVLLQNLDAIAAAPATNIIRRHLELFGVALTREGVRSLSPAQAKELGTVIVASYDTTALSLLWAILYLEATPSVKARLRRCLDHDRDLPSRDALLDDLVLEAVRLGGSNPTALYRRTVRTCRVEHQGRRAVVPPGVMLWLDRRAANRDASVFRCPHAFDPEHVTALRRGPRDHAQSLTARNRYEINSFSMINSERNPRKCPGRYFAVRMQALVIDSLYRRYDVRVEGAELALAPFSAMPRPRQPGRITLTPRSLRG